MISASGLGLVDWVVVEVNGGAVGGIELELPDVWVLIIGVVVAGGVCCWVVVELGAGVGMAVVVVGAGVCGLVVVEVVVVVIGVVVGNGVVVVDVLVVGVGVVVEITGKLDGKLPFSLTVWYVTGSPGIRKRV